MLTLEKELHTLVKRKLWIIQIKIFSIITLSILHV